MKTKIFILIILFFGIVGSIHIARMMRKTTPNPEAISLLEKMASDGDLIIAKKTKGKIPLDPQSKLWQETKETVVPLVSQTSVTPRTPVSRQTQVSVRALYNRKELGILLSWSDPTKDRRVAKAEQFQDAVAVAFPMNYGEGVLLPYIGMGNKGRPVNIWQWKASWQADIDQGYQGVEATHTGMIPNNAPLHFLTGEDAGSPLSQQRRVSPAENLIAEGFGTLTSVPSRKLSGKGIWKNERWQVVIKRSLRSGKTGTRIQPKKGLIPMTLAIWDGSSMERNGMKGITRWRFLKFEEEVVPLASLKSLVIGPLPNADAARGKQLVIDFGCVSCHSLPGKPAKQELGPNLTHAGAIHRPEYLLESIQDPNAVIVPAPGYFDQQNGISTMPSYEEILQEKDTYDMVEYMRRLQ